MPLYRAELLAKKPLRYAALIHDVSQVLYLPFDWDDSSYARDRSGYNNHGTIYGATPVTGKIGMARSLDGVDDYMEVPHNTSLMVTTDFSIEWWVKPNTIKDQMPVSKGIYLTDGYYVVMNGAGQVGFTTQIEGIQTQILSYELQYDTGIWQHFAVTKSGSLGRVYKNGVELPKKVDDALNDPTTNIRPLLLGRYSGGGWQLDGIIDEVRIYSRALSQDEIRMLMYRRLI